MADHLFGDVFDPKVPEAPIPAPDVADHLFGGHFSAPPPKEEKSLYRKWLDETISGSIAKAAGKFMALPGDAAQGKFETQPATPGQWSDTDEARAQINARNLVDRSTQAAGFVGTGGIPSVTRAGASSVPFLNSGVSSETAQIAKTAIEKYGYPVRPGQMSENHFVRSLDSLLQKIPGSGYAKSAEGQQTAINRGVAKLIGQDADKITPEVMANAKTDLGAAYKKIYGSDVKAPLDDKFSHGILDTLERAGQVLDDPNKVKVLNKAVSNILDKVKGDGSISGPAYQGLRQTGSVLKDLEGSGGKLGDYAREIKGHLDDLFRRTIPPDKANLLQKTDQQYAIMKQLRPLAADATATGGDVSAARLMQIAKSGEAGRERMAFGKGGDLGELAAIGQRFKTMPSSNTAENSALLDILTKIGGYGGAAITGGGIASLNPILAAAPLATAGAGLATSRLLGTYMKNPKRAEKLIEDALNRKGPRDPNKLIDAGIAPYLPAIQSGAGQ